jgi:hypothetical protein
MKDVMLHNHACTVGDLTCSMCWHVVYHPYSPVLFHHVMSICVCVRARACVRACACLCGLQVSEALEPGCMKMLRPPWCSDFSSSQSSSAIAWCDNGLLASRPMKSIFSGLAFLHRTIPPWVSYEQVMLWQFMLLTSFDGKAELFLFCIALTTHVSVCKPCTATEFLQM